jgi:hypothetical protein
MFHFLASTPGMYKVNKSDAKWRLYIDRCILQGLVGLSQGMFLWDTPVASISSIFQTQPKVDIRLRLDNMLQAPFE